MNFIQTVNFTIMTTKDVILIIDVSHFQLLFASGVRACTNLYVEISSTEEECQ